MKSADILRYVDAALESEAAEIAASPRGGRNNALFAAAAALGQLVSQGLDEARIEERLLDAAGANGLVGDDGREAALKTIRSGIDRGKSEPRKITDRQPALTAGNRRAPRRDIVRSLPGPVSAEPEKLYVATSPVEAMTTPVDFPARTPPDAEGKPKFNE